MQEGTEKQLLRQAKKVWDMMTPEQQELAGQKKAWEQQKALNFPLGTPPMQSVGHFHSVMGLPTPELPVMPTVTERILRARIMTEEFLETLFKGLGVTLHLTTAEGQVIQVGPGDLESEKVSWGIHHREGDKYDLVETADGLSDLNVVVNGTGVHLGIPLHFTDHEVYCSNLTKLDEEGKPVINGVTDGYREGEAGYKNHLPVGKILKPDGFIKANIPAAIMAYVNKEV